ncbi:AI-2E family transporter [bacterium]|nr:AI-2E family transporter [bacterium]
MNGLILFVGALLLLWIGRTILIPFLAAVFFWYLINAIAAYYRKAMPKNPRFPRVWNILSGILAGATLIGVVYLFSTQVRPMFSELMAALPDIQQKLTTFVDFLSVRLGVAADTSMLPNITKIAANLGASAVGMATTVGMVVVYMLFMFVEQSTFHKKLAALFPNRTRAKKMRYILGSIDENMKKYLFMKTLISGATGLMSYFWLTAIGLPFAGVWAFIIFVANYIPTIGSIVACGLPILYALVSTDTWNLPLLVALGLIGLQILFGNIIEPKLTGKTLNLSTLAILINLVFWGGLWGVAGMFFSVPLLVATFIVMAQFDSTRWIAVLLSADGKIPNKSDE